ncbi:hypothetical protein ANRL4_03799 [Anaerolineae bacterium]|nr:hypothetical protein ANRL4_03799 [Anaerolineae bacterium]
MRYPFPCPVDYRIAVPTSKNTDRITATGQS